MTEIIRPVSSLAQRYIAEDVYNRSICVSVENKERPDQLPKLRVASFDPRRPLQSSASKIRKPSNIIQTTPSNIQLGLIVIHDLPELEYPNGFDFTARVLADP